MNKYTQEHYDFISKNVKGLSNKELLTLVNKRFGNLFTAKTLKAYKTNHKLSSGLTGRFEKGHIAHNKGKKIPPEVYEKIKVTMFQKGHRPHNAHPVGVEIEDATPEHYIKVKIAEPDVWKYKHHIIWEKETGQKIPKGGVIIFLDGNRRNFDISNLACITKNENCRLNQNNLRCDNADITQANINIIRLDNLIREKKKQ